MTDLMNIISYTPKKSPMRLDIMVNDRWKETINIPCTVGVTYEYKELKSFVRMKRPSLKYVDFDLLPCEKPTFRN